MIEQNYWISGGVGSGKTETLIQEAWQWWQAWRQRAEWTSAEQVGRSALFFAMNADNRADAAVRLTFATQGELPLRTTTPLGFFEDEVTLFWPLIVDQVSTVPRLPLRLRPEAEQFWAVEFWGASALESLNEIERFSVERWARNLLDVIQLSAFAGIPLEEASARLHHMWPASDGTVPRWNTLGRMLTNWRDWCLQQGWITYGLLTELYWRYLLPHPQYQDQLRQRFMLILADDVESYPAIARTLFEQVHQLGLKGMYSFNPDFSVRLGLGADPDSLKNLEHTLSCTLKPLPMPHMGIGAELWPVISDILDDRPVDLNLEGIEQIRTMTRSQLLRETAQRVIDLVHAGQAQPGEIAILGPGLDSLARYALIDIIEAQGIPVVSLNEQRPLVSSALVRSLLTLLAFIYPGLGHLINQETVAEMLVVLTTDYSPPDQAIQNWTRPGSSYSRLDPIRAGLLADYCFRPDSDRPELLPLETFVRWDRIGSQGATAYQHLRTWINDQRQLIQQQGAEIQPLMPKSPSSQSRRFSPVDVLCRATEFFWANSTLRYDQNAVLRELLETAQHFWTVAKVLRSTTSPHLLRYTLDDGNEEPFLEQFIELVRKGTMAANPYPESGQGRASSGVILSTAYQYRIARLFHRYHFWLDIGSPLWQQGSLIELWGYQAFLHTTQVDDFLDTRSQQIVATKAQVNDLLHRASHKIIFCHSDLAVSGQEQMGELLSLLEAIE